MRKHTAILALLAIALTAVASIHIFIQKDKHVIVENAELKETLSAKVLEENTIWLENYFKFDTLITVPPYGEVNRTLKKYGVPLVKTSGSFYTVEANDGAYLLIFCADGEVISYIYASFVEQRYPQKARIYNSDDAFEIIEKRMVLE